MSPEEAHQQQRVGLGRLQASEAHGPQNWTLDFPSSSLPPLLQPRCKDKLGDFKSSSRVISLFWCQTAQLIIASSVRGFSFGSRWFLPLQYCFLQSISRPLFPKCDASSSFFPPIEVLEMSGWWAPVANYSQNASQELMFCVYARCLV